MNRELAQAAWILQRLPSEVASIIINKVFETGFAWQKKNTPSDIQFL